MSELLYPARKRCRKCRQFFVWTVVDRRFCSHQCAGQVDPAVIRPFPRQHVRRDGEPKREFLWPEDPELLEILEREGDAARSYRCGHCESWHIGH